MDKLTYVFSSTLRPPSISIAFFSSTSPSMASSKIDPMISMHCWIMIGSNRAAHTFPSAGIAWRRYASFCLFASLMDICTRNASQQLYARIVSESMSHCEQDGTAISIPSPPLCPPPVPTITSIRHGGWPEESCPTGRNRDASQPHDNLDMRA